MNRRQRIIISVTAIFLILLILVGLTYAYFLTRINGNPNNTSISVTTANLVLEYGNGENGNIILSNIQPGETIPAKDFTVTNKGNATVEDYKVYLENVQNQFELKDDVTYTLTCNEYDTEDYDAYIEDGTALPAPTLCTGVSTPTEFPSVMSVIATNDIAQGKTQVYSLQVLYPDDGDQSIDMNKLLKAKVNIYDGKTKFLTTEIMNNVKTGINGTTYVEPTNLGVTANTTVPGLSINNQNEKIVSYTYDDLGTSYYYRGNVQDNYVEFANKCWRIVRIEGDGSIRMILASNNGGCSTISTTSAFIGNAAYNSTGALDYENGETKVALNSWYSTNFANYTSQIKLTEQCIGDLVTKYNENGVAGDYSNVTWYSETSKRLYGYGQDIEVKIKCDEGWTKTSASGAYLLSADEVTLAGGKVNENNIKYYIANNLTNKSWRIISMQGYYYHTVSDQRYQIFAIGAPSEASLFMWFSGITNSAESIRPMITLKSNVQLIGDGNGLVGTPYVIAQPN